MWTMTRDKRAQFAEDVLFRYYQGEISRWTAFNMLVEAGYGIDNAKRMLDRAEQLHFRSGQELME